MSHRRGRVALEAILGLGLLTAAAGCEAPPAEPRIVALAEFDRALNLPPLEATPVHTPGRLRFGDGWWEPEAEGVWAVASEATIDVALAGDSLELIVNWSAAQPMLPQTVEVWLDDQRLGAMQQSLSWVEQEIRWPLPPPDPSHPDATRWGTLRFRSSVVDSVGRRTLAFFLRRLAVESLEGHDRALAYQPPSEPEWDPVSVEPTPTDRAQDRPDLLVILLDALRARQVGAYGYDRPTTPTLDSLAATGLRFEKAFAPAPFTRLSVASLFTGRSWSEHGVVDQGLALPDSMLGWAQILGDAGYNTLGISPNPHVSIAVGSDRGFQQWDQVWEEHPRWNDVRKVDRPESALRDWLDGPQAADLSTPAFAYVHLRPPHAPYDPDPEWNVWADPSYDGPFDGAAPRIRRVNLGLIGFEPEDATQVRALYDGLLRQVDATVSRILAAWRQSRGNRPVIVAVLSDHGEALGERGLLGHNQNVHVELTQIALLLSPRARVEALAPQTRSLVAIQDLLPMLLHVLDLPLPAERTWPRRAVELHRDPTHRRAGILQRSNSQNTHFGLRSEDWLAIWDGWQRQELYELRGDPEEATNLWRERPGLYLERVTELIRRAAVTLPEAAPEAQPSAADLERLRSLGYID